MRSKNKKRKSAYRRGEKLVIFFRRGTVCMIIAVFIASAFFGAKLLARQFRLQEIIVTGNYHLDAEDIVKSLHIGKGDPILNVHSRNIDHELNQNPWIKNVSVKKQLPGTLLIDIEEAVPKALLRVAKKMYLIDRDGAILEEIKADGMLFLPVINGISTKNRKGISEAMKLVDVLNRKHVFADRESVEIGIEPYGLTMNIDGEFIKVGYGRYAEKFERWTALEPEIRRRGEPIKYVDLRFKDSVIIKPLKRMKKESAS